VWRAILSGMANRVDPSLREANDILRQKDDRSNNVTPASSKVKVIGGAEARAMLKELRGHDVEMGKAVLGRWQKWDDEGRIQLEPDARRMIDMAQRNADVLWNLRS
jgi:hypothetical protein